MPPVQRIVCSATCKKVALRARICGQDVRLAMTPLESGAAAGSLSDSLRRVRYHKPSLPNPCTQMAARVHSRCWRERLTHPCYDRRTSRRRGLGQDLFDLKNVIPQHAPPNGERTSPDPLHACPFGLLVGLTLLIGPPCRLLVLSRMFGTSTGMSLGWFQRRLLWPLGMLPLGLRWMIFGLIGVGMLDWVSLRHMPRLEDPLWLAALPFLEEVCCVFVAGVWEAELLAA